MICILLTGRKLVCQTGAVVGPFLCSRPGLFGLWWGSDDNGLRGVGRREERRGREKSEVMGRREHIINGLRKGLPLSFSHKNKISK